MNTKSKSGYPSLATENSYPNEKLLNEKVHSVKKLPYINSFVRLIVNGLKNVINLD